MAKDARSEANEIIGLRSNQAAVVARLREKSSDELIELIPYLFSTGYTGAEIEAIRVCTQSLIANKLAAQMSASVQELNTEISRAVNELNRSTTRLTRVGWIVSAVLALVTILLPLLLSKIHR